MFSRRCSLCDGKLDGRKICKECGLDNSKSEKYYKINQSSCDNMPLTHVHEKKHEDIWDYKKVITQKSTTKKSTAKKKSEKSLISILVSVISLCAFIIPALLGIFANDSYTSEPEWELNAYESPYEYVDAVHPADGEYAEYSLTSGDYIVGIHIPEGDYIALVNAEYDTVQVRDDDNGIYLYEYEAKEWGNYLDDLRLFNGAIVSITTQTEIELQSSNAQYQNMGYTFENPLKDVYYLEQDYTAEAGVDFQPGVYNLYSAADYAYVTLTIIDEFGEEWEYYYNLEIGEESVCGVLYQNMVIPEGASIKCIEGDVELMPGSTIGDIDYSRYYW